MPVPLPIDAVLSELCAALRGARAAVLEAPPGAGKTTRVPPALLAAGLAGDGEVLVLEPRRLAARLAARRVAEELGEEVGDTVGYQMRFESAGGPRTRIRFVTEGVLTRRLLDDPTLRGVGAVVLDELHERHLQGDVALAMLRRLQRTTRPELVLCAMSATLDAGPVAAFLGDAPVVRAEGRRFDVEIEHLPRAPDRPLHELLPSVLRRLLSERQGDVLVFMPGAAEIRRSMEACAGAAHAADALLLPLHGSLSPAEQDRAVRPADRRKVIVSTNVAESSVTIDGVAAVVDSGLARVAAHAPWSGLPTLRVMPISRASATQRAGRAGRTRDGACVRLYTRGDLAARPEYDAPEVARADLAETALELYAAGVTDLESFPWFEAPPAASLGAARTLLERLGAVESGEITELGRSMLAFPTHPRLSRVIAEGERRGVGQRAAALAALISERDVRASSSRLGHGARGAGARSGPNESPSADVLDALEAYREASLSRFDPHRLRALGIDPGRAQAASRVARQLERMLGRARRRRDDEAPWGPREEEEALRIAILAGYPDRVGRLRRPTTASGRTGLEVVFAGGGSAVLADDTGGWQSELIVAVDVEERTEGRSTRTVVRLASSVHPDWLLELFLHEVRDETEVTWNAAAGRVESARTLSYHGLVLERTPTGRGDSEQSGKLLAEAARSRGWRTFTDAEALERWLARIAFVRRALPEVGIGEIDEGRVLGVLDELCRGRTSFVELEEADLASAVRALLDPAQTRAVAEGAPDFVQLPGGRRVRVDYASEPPSIASRLQDFFGMATGPAVAKGRVPLVLHLLAPNQRAVQVTTDLAGFWDRHYPAIARELRRRYPRHAWPDDPRRAQPPAAGRR